MDAICCPADISYPQDFQLLNEAREKLEHIVDAYCEVHKLKKPRMRRRAARKDYLNLSKCKKPKRYGKAFGSSCNISGGILALLWILFGKPI